MKNKNKNMIKNISKKAGIIFLSALFLLNSFSFSWADYGRAGNYGEGNSFTNTFMGVLAGVASPSSTGSWGTWGMNTFSTSIGSYIGLYIYVNYYHDYGKPLIKFNIGGEEISISRGQFFTMVASTVACSLAGLASGGYNNMTEWAKNTGNQLVTNTAKLVISETIKDYLVEKYDLDPGIAQVLGDTVADYAAESVSAAYLNSIGILGGDQVTQDGNIVSGEEEQAANQRYLEVRAAKSAEIEQAKKEYDKAVTENNPAAAKAAKDKMDKAAFVIKLHSSAYQTKYGHLPGDIEGSGILGAMGRPWTRTGNLYRGLVKAGVLMALDYDSYRGPNRNREHNNALKMAIAEGAGTTAALAFGSESNVSIGEAITYGATSAVTNMVWQSMLHDLNIPSSTVTEFARLSLSGLVLGLSNKISGVNKGKQTYEQYAKANSLPNESEHQTYEQYLKENGAMTEEEFYSSQEYQSTLTKGKVLAMATKLEGDPRKEYSAYLESKGLQTPDGKVPEGGKAYVSYQAALKQKGAMTKEEYTRGGYAPATVGGTVRRSVAVGMNSASPRNPANMRQQIEMRGKGMYGIQTEGALLQNAFYSVANDNFGQSAANFLKTRESASRDAAAISRNQGAAATVTVTFTDEEGKQAKKEVSREEWERMQAEQIRAIREQARAAGYTGQLDTPEQVQKFLEENEIVTTSDPDGRVVKREVMTKQEFSRVQAEQQAKRAEQQTQRTEQVRAIREQARAAGYQGALDTPEQVSEFLETHEIVTTSDPDGKVVKREVMTKEQFAKVQAEQQTQRTEQIRAIREQARAAGYTGQLETPEQVQKFLEENEIVTTTDPAGKVVERRVMTKQEFARMQAEQQTQRTEQIRAIREQARAAGYTGQLETPEQVQKFLEENEIVTTSDPDGRVVKREVMTKEEYAKIRAEQERMMQQQPERPIERAAPPVVEQPQPSVAPEQDKARTAPLSFLQPAEEETPPVNTVSLAEPAGIKAEAPPVELNSPELQAQPATAGELRDITNILRNQYGGRFQKVIEGDREILRENKFTLNTRDYDFRFNNQNGIEAIDIEYRPRNSTQPWQPIDENSREIPSVAGLAPIVEIGPMEEVYNSPTPEANQRREERERQMRANHPDNQPVKGVSTPITFNGLQERVSRLGYQVATNRRMSMSSYDEPILSSVIREGRGDYAVVVFPEYNDDAKALYNTLKEMEGPYGVRVSLARDTFGRRNRIEIKREGYDGRIPYHSYIRDEDLRPVSTPKSNDPQAGAIRGAQEVLVQEGIDIGRSGPSGNGVDGIMGKRTQEGITEFQRRNNLTVTGQLDTGTLKALRERREAYQQPVDFGDMSDRPALEP